MLVTLLAVRSWWRARVRRLDVEILWPLCRAGASDLDYAKAAFALHAFNEPAWRELGDEALIDFIDRLA